MRFGNKIFSLILSLVFALALHSCLGTDEVDSDPDIVQAPANLAATKGDGSISLSWDAVDGAIYKVYYGTASGTYDGTGATEGNSPIETNQDTFILTGLVNGDEYFVAVTAVKEENESEYSNEVNALLDLFSDYELSPMHDGYIIGRGFMPETIDDTGIWLRAGIGPNQAFYWSKSYLKFDLTSYDINKITQARLNLHKVGEAADDGVGYPLMQLYSINDYGDLDFDNDWSLDSTGDLISEFDGTPSDYEIDIPLGKLKAQTNSFILTASITILRQYFLASSEYTDDISKRPVLKVKVNNY